MIYGYVRISTDKQTVENQRFEIQNYCDRNGLTIDKWIEETVSGTVDAEKRKLGKLLKKAGENDMILACELSRFGRNLLQVMAMLNLCMNKGVEVRTIKDNYTLGKDIQSKVLAFAFTLSAEIERQLISQRTMRSLERLKAEGKKLGRPKGSPNTSHKLDGQDKKIRALLDKGLSFSEIARMFQVDTRTVKRAVLRFEC